MADFLATNEFDGTGAVMQVEVNFAGVRVDLPNQPAPYLEADDVLAAIVTPATNTTVEVVTPTDLTQINALTFRTTVVVPVGQTLRVYRSTDIEFPIVDFVSLQVVTESDLDTQARQTLYAVMESSDNSAIAVRNSQTASETATEAFVLATEAVSTANAATVTANTASASAANAVATANAASTRSDLALSAAASAEQHAEAVETLAQQAGDDADAAAASAVAANTAANQAVATANGVDAKAQSALDNSVTATNTANAAAATANGIAATANQANATANQANTTANAAQDTANQASTAANAAQAAVANKQDHSARLDQIVSLTATSGAYSIVSLDANGAAVKLPTSTFVGGTLLPVASATAFRDAIGVGSAQNVSFGNITSSGDISAAGSVTVTGGVSANNLVARGGVAQLNASSATSNAYIGFYNPDGTTRGVVYADSSKQVHIQSNGVESAVFGATGITTLRCVTTDRQYGQSTMYSQTSAVNGSLFSSSCLQLQGNSGGLAALGFLNVDRVASALYLNADGTLHVVSNFGVDVQVATSGNFPNLLASTVTTATLGALALVRNRTGAAQAAGATLASGLNYSDTTGTEGGAVPGTWRLMQAAASAAVVLAMRIG